MAMRLLGGCALATLAAANQYDTPPRAPSCPCVAVGADQGLVAVEMGCHRTLTACAPPPPGVMRCRYDVLFPNYIAPAECPQGCAAWGDVEKDGVANMTQSEVNALFRNGTVHPDAGSQCIMPGASPVHGEGRRMLTSDDEEDRWMWDTATKGANCDDATEGKCVLSAAAGPYCLCKNGAAGGKSMGYCTPPMSTPEQINLQYAAADIVVAAFVTYEKEPSTKPPSAMFGEAGGKGAKKMLTGVTHWYVEPLISYPLVNGTAKRQNETGRNYSMHFVKFDGLKPGTKYTYKVKSPTGTWSEEYTFRSLRPYPETKIAMYGDMGFSQYNNMANLLKDCQSGDIDVFAHMGDHAYDLGMEDDRKGDAYMNALQPLLSTCPWIPIIGNHEAGDGDKTHRYLNQTWGGAAYGNPLENMTSTATSALGHVLTKGTFLGAGLHGTTPSGTSAYFSVDVGLFHIAALSTQNPTGDELAWLEADLAAATAPEQRKKVPWIIATSHYPIYSPTMDDHSHCSAQAYESVEGEIANPSALYRTCEENGEDPDCATVGDVVQAAKGLEQLLMKYNVDIWNAGHVHDYQVTWPIVNGTAPSQSYKDPLGPVYITEGNGGVPGVTGTHTFKNVSQQWGRIHGLGGAYGILSAKDFGRLQYDHVWNNGNNGTGEIMETFALERSTPHFAQLLRK